MRFRRARCSPSRPVAAPGAASVRTPARDRAPGRSTRCRATAVRRAAAFGSSAATCSDVSRVVVIGHTAAEHQRRDVEAAGVVVGQARDELSRAAAVGLHPSLHRRDELLRFLGQELFAVRRVALEHLLPARDGRHGLHPAVPHRGRPRRRSSSRERQEAEDAAADPPDRDRLATSR